MKHIFVVVLTILSLVGCTSKNNNQLVKTPDKFCIPDSLMKQIQLDTVSFQSVVSEHKLIGKISYDQDKVAKIYPMVSGNATEVRVALGDYVKKGQVLAILKSSEVAGVTNDLVSASSNLAVAEKNLAATADMYKSGIASEKEYIAAQKETEKARSELNRVKTVHAIYGSGAQSEYVVKSPISGYVVEKNINPNMQIRPDNNTNLFTISDLKTVWVLANVYESDIARIKLNQKVNVTTISYPDKVFTGNIDKIYSVLDPDSKTMKIRVQLGNEQNLLKPEMFANVLVHQVTDSTQLAIPAKAVIFDRNQYWVMVYNSKCDVQTRKIDIQSSNSTTTYIRSGVKPGEKVITNLQLLIYNALNQ